MRLNKNPKISIVIPSYNQGDFIQETIESILIQEYENIEIIVIDGGSSDNTLSILKKYSNNFKHWVSEPDRGQSHAINKGLNHVTGDIFNWLNSDDTLTEGSLNHIAKAYLETNFDLFIGKVRRFNEFETVDIISGYYGEFNKDSYMLKRFFQPSTFINTNVLPFITPVNEDLQYTMDVEMYMRYLLQFGYKKTVTSKIVLSNFRMHNDSKTHNHINIFKKEIEYSFYTLFNKLENSKLNTLLEEVVLKGYKTLNYELGMPASFNFKDRKLLLRTLTNFIYPYFSKLYVSKSVLQANRLLPFIKYSYLDKKYRKTFIRQFLNLQLKKIYA